ncbi:MAG TPA: formate dehydrogenase subunit gamma, partial [Ramlibacter sp.]|nr:formate dehydrogenase subunit gamma [Ramlibacter sp.]
MLRSLLLTLSLAAGLCVAQTRPQDDPPPPGAGGIQGQNILDVKPEVKPDASADPNYMKQGNAERNRVQPGNNAPIWRGVVSGQEGFTSLPRSQAPEAGVLIQPPVQYPGSRLTTAGEAWRQVRNNWIIPYGGALFLIALGALALFYLVRGPLGHAANEGGRIERFTAFERSAHWANAITFVTLAISGIVMAFGKLFLLPVLGLSLFGGLTYVLKTLHNFAGPVFAVSLVIVFLTFLRDNWPQRGDLGWLLRAGGAFSQHGGEPPSHRFNAGEKIVFWGGVFFLGLIVVASGLVMDKLIPNLVYDRGTMQVAHMVHAVAAVLMLCLFALHIYVGTIGMRGAFKAMRHGYVDEAWA